jgi:hypothetical protein
MSTWVCLAPLIQVGVVLELNMASTIGHPVSWVFYTLIILMDTGVIHGIYWEW